MRIALFHDAKLPCLTYGGTERVVWWLAKGLSELGHSVLLVCRPESHCPYAESILPIQQFTPPQAIAADVCHYFATPPFTPSTPYLVTIEGNGKLGERFLPNTVFVSRNHARRHHSECFVYNGLDPEDYIYRGKKSDYLCFLAKAKWRVKNVAGAIQLAKKSRMPLKILGGSRWWSLSRSIRWEGMVGGSRKAEILSHAAGLIFPIIWNEPFGIAVTEALISGTPVVATRRGSMPELIGEDVGKLCDSEEDFLEGLKQLPTFQSSRCRDWAMAHFTYKTMAARYLSLYERVLAGESLNPVAPETQEDPEILLPY